MNDELTDTPRTDACPHCRAGIYALLGLGNETTYWQCGSNPVGKGEVSRSTECYEKELAASKAEVERLGGLLYQTRSLLTEFFDCVDIGGLHDGGCNITTEDPEKWDLGCNCTTAELRRKYIELYSK